MKRYQSVSHMGFLACCAVFISYPRRSLVRGYLSQILSVANLDHCVVSSCCTVPVRSSWLQIFRQKNAYSFVYLRLFLNTYVTEENYPRHSSRSGWWIYPLDSCPLQTSGSTLKSAGNAVTNCCCLLHSYNS